jgi:hypothetical protein
MYNKKSLFFGLITFISVFLFSGCTGSTGVVTPQYQEYVPINSSAPNIQAAISDQQDAVEVSAVVVEAVIPAPKVKEPEQQLPVIEIKVPEPVVVEVPLSPPALASVYDCSYNRYNCGDFATHNKAQQAYTYCGGVSNDVHGLDRDKDGKACESLP